MVGGEIRKGHGVSLKGRRISACAPDTEGRRASRAGIAALPLCARGAGKGMTSGVRLPVRGGGERAERRREWVAGLSAEETGPSERRRCWAAAGGERAMGERGKRWAAG